MSAKFVSPEAPPTAFQREVLEILIEECAEVQQRATKMLRFGVIEIQPGQPYTNRARLALEIGDLLEIIFMATETRLIFQSDIDEGREKKKKQLAKFMQQVRP